MFKIKDLVEVKGINDCGVKKLTHFSSAKVMFDKYLRVCLFRLYGEAAVFDKYKDCSFLCRVLGKCWHYIFM